MSVVTSGEKASIEFFCFDFHQFLLFFIDIFKTLESVTTFIELFQSKHRFVISGSRNT